MPDVVIVVDMQRCFMEEGKTLYCGAQAREIIPRIQKLLERESRRGSQILFTADTHTENDLEFKMFPRHCVAGTGDAEIIPELQPWVKPDHVIHKRRYSALLRDGPGAAAGRSETANGQSGRRVHGHLRHAQRGGPAQPGLSRHRCTRTGWPASIRKPIGSPCGI